MIVIYLKTASRDNVFFDEGVNFATLAADMDVNVRVIVGGDLAEELASLQHDDDTVKKLRQLELFAITVLADRVCNVPFIHPVSGAEIADNLQRADKVLTF